MAQILAFAGSNSSTSINFKMVKYTAGLVSDHDVRVLNMTNYPFPMYSEDLEKKSGFSNSLVEFKDDIKAMDGLIISVNEHNGGPSAYFKNLLDWLSRLERSFLADKKIFLIACSPGGRGGKGSLDYCKSTLPRFGAEIVSVLSFPNFHNNFKQDEGILNADLKSEHTAALEDFLNKL